MAAISEDLLSLFQRINSTPDFGYVDFTHINATNALGENALHVAVVWGDVAAVKLLLAAGIEIDRPGEDAYTPLHYACSHGHMEIAQILLDAGANPFARTVGELPFTLARLDSNDAMCDLLSKYMTNSPHRPKTTPQSEHIARLKNQIHKLEKFVEANCEKK